MKFTLNFIHSLKFRNISYGILYFLWKYITITLLHACIMTYLLCLSHIFKLYYVISTCFVLNMFWYGGHNMKANSPLINFILGYCINPMILNTKMTHDEQNPDEQNPDDHTSIDEDRQTPLSRNPQSTPKKFFKAICLSWSLSVSDNFTCLLSVNTNQTNH